MVDGIIDSIGDIIRRQRPSRGPFHPEPRLWKSNAVREKLGPLIAAHPTRATVTHNEDRLNQRDIRIEVIDPDEIEPHKDYILAELAITDADGRTETYKLGHFLITEREITTSKLMRTGVLQGWDGTRALSSASMPVPVIFNGGDPGAAVRQFLGIYGMPETMYDIPDAGVDLPGGHAWDAGTLWITIINDLLAMGNMYAIYCDGEGVFRSRKYEDIAQATPQAHYGTHNGAFIVPPVVERPDFSRLKNRVVVRKIMPDQDPIVAVAEVTDPSSPVHPMRLAEARGQSWPVYLEGDPIDDPQLPDGEEGRRLAQERAESILSNGASYYRVLRLETPIDHVLEPHSTVSLDIRHDENTYYSGNWRQRVWTIDLNGPNAIIQRELYRTEPWR